jgi:uncharacterized delta-60 repeat protein
MSNNNHKFVRGFNLPPINLSDMTGVGAGDMFCDAADNKIKQWDPTTSSFQAIPKQSDVTGLQANDLKVKATSADTTGDHLNNKIGVTAGKLTKTITNPAGNEVITLNIGADVFDKTTNTTDNITQGATNKWYATSLFNADLATKTTDNLTEGATNKYYTDERVDDRIANLFQEGTGINMTYNDTLNQFHIEQDINGVTPITIPEQTDALLVHDASSGVIKKITRGDFLAGLPTNTGVPAVYRFNINGNLGQYSANFAKRLDGGVAHNSFLPTTFKMTLNEVGRSGQLKVDMRIGRNVNVPIEDITPQYDSRASVIANVVPNHPTQSIARISPQLGTQSITRAKAALNIEQVFVENGNTRYLLASVPDSDWAVGDTVVIDQCLYTANNGTFTILAMGNVAYPNSILTSNTAGQPELIPGGNDNAAFLANLGTAVGTATNTSDTAYQSTGKILIVGGFTTWNGLTRNRMVRLNADGTEDAAFYTNLGTGFGASTEFVAVQADDKIIVTGSFTTLNGITRNRIVRLNSDGTLDTAFMTNIGTGFNAGTREVAIDSSGNIYVTGDFTTFNGLTRNRIVKLFPTGVEDAAWYAAGGTGFNAPSYRCKIDGSGRLMVGGDFTAFNGVTGRNKIARLLTTGAYDTSWAPTGVGLGATASQYVWDILVQTDGKIILGGLWTTYNAVSRPYLIRLNSDGTEDTAFSTNLGTFPNNHVYALHQMNDGRILVGGNFTAIGGVTNNYIALLENSGALDPYTSQVFFGGFNNYVYNFSQDTAGNILFGGLFTTWAGLTYNRIIRFKQSLVLTKGRVNLQLFSFNYSAPVDTNAFVPGEKFLSASHTLAANNGQGTIYKVNQGGNNIWCKIPAGAVQTSAVGNVNTNRWKYATNVIPSNQLVVGEKAKMAGHTTAANNGNFFIRIVESNGITVYNEAGVAQAGVVGTINTNRWTYQVTEDPTTNNNLQSGDLVRAVNFVTAANNGNFTVLAVTSSLVTIYNEAGVAQTSSNSLGELISEKKILRFASDNSSNIGLDSFLELNLTQDNTYYLTASKNYQVFQVNRGGGFNAVIKEIATGRQLGKMGYVEIESRSIFTTLPVIPAEPMTLTGGRKARAGTFGAVFNGMPVPADTYLSVWILENFTDNVAKDLTVIIS